MSLRSFAAGVLALALTLGGLALLFAGLERAVPPVFWGTPEEVEAREAGRTIVRLAAVALFAAGALLVARGRHRPAAIVAAAGAAPAGLLILFPWTLFAWIPFAALAPPAFVAAFAGLRPAGSSG